MATANEIAKARTVDMKFEIVVIPVSDVDRAKHFYDSLGWRLDADFAAGDDYRVIQFTPPGSGCSIIFGKNVTAAAPGSAQGLYLIVSDIEAARAELRDRGVEVSDVFHDAGGVYLGNDEPYLFGRLRVRFRKSPRGCRDASRRTRHSSRRRILRPRCAAPPSRMASTRSASATMMRPGPTGMPTIWSGSRRAKSCRRRRRLGTSSGVGRQMSCKPSFSPSSRRRPGPITTGLRCGDRRLLHGSTERFRGMGPRLRGGDERWARREPRA